MFSEDEIVVCNLYEGFGGAVEFAEVAEHGDLRLSDWGMADAADTALSDRGREPLDRRPSSLFTRKRSRPVRTGTPVICSCSAITVSLGAGLVGGAPSMRLKSLREGVNDFEYVQILKGLGQDTWALQKAGIVGQNWHTRTRYLADIEAVRITLGNQIDQLSRTNNRSASTVLSRSRL